MKTELIEKLENFLQTGDISGISAEIRTLKSTFENQLQKEQDAARQEFLDGGGDQADFTFSKTAEDLRLEELFKEFAVLRKVHEKQVQEEQAKNLIIKRGIVDKIKSLGDIQSQPGKALKALKELQTLWKETGAVSSHAYKDLQNEYSKAVEAFYYSLDIYKVLQEHDFKKNHELKMEIIGKLHQLVENVNIKEIERLIKVYRNDWDDIGPVQNAKWDELKVLWRTGLDLIYAKLKTHYLALEEQKEKNLAAKQALLEKAQALANEIPTDEESWKKGTEAILALQKEWKTVGFTQKGKNEQSWKNFREACDRFFEAKNTFYAGIREVRGDMRKQKMELIQKAEELSTSTDWKETTEKIIRIQAAWKKAPPSGLPDESRLFHRFRKACNVFFDAKKKHFEDLDAAAAGEVKGLEELLQKFQTAELSGDVTKDKETLREYSTAWQQVKGIPPRDRKKLNDRFYQHMDALYDKLNVNESELHIIRFRNKLEKLEQDDSSGQLLQREYDHIKKQAEQIHLEILKYENNLGFFKSSKGDNPLLADIRNKIAAEKEKLAGLKQKQKMAGELLNRIVA
jgi:hypothetical protein